MVARTTLAQHANGGPDVRAEPACVLGSIIGDEEVAGGDTVAVAAEVEDVAAEGSEVAAGDGDG